MQQLIITIDPLGKPVIEAKGFTGSNCTLASDRIVKALSGGQSNVVIDKPEMHEMATNEPLQLMEGQF